MKSYIFLTVLLLHPSLGFALTTFECESPVGSRLDFSKTELDEKGEEIPMKQVRKSEDGIGGIRPRFIFDEKNPQELLVVMDNSELVGKALQPEPAKKAHVLTHSSLQISAILSEKVFDGATIWLYSIFPQDGIAYFSRHRGRNEVASRTNVLSLSAKCRILKE